MPMPTATFVAASAASVGAPRVSCLAVDQSVHANSPASSSAATVARADAGADAGVDSHGGGDGADAGADAGADSHGGGACVDAGDIEVGGGDAGAGAGAGTRKQTLPGELHRNAGHGRSNDGDSGVRSHKRPQQRPHLAVILVPKEALNHCGAEPDRRNAPQALARCYLAKPLGIEVALDRVSSLPQPAEAMGKITPIRLVQTCSPPLPLPLRQSAATIMVEVLAALFSFHPVLFFNDGS